MSKAQDSWRERLIFAHLEEPPFCFVEADGEVAGCDVELARLVCNRIGVAVFQTILVDFNALIPGLIGQRFHMTTGFFITLEREHLVAFSRPIWALADGLLVRAAGPRRLRSLNSIATDREARLAVVADQVQEITALKAGVAPNQIRRYASQADASSAVARGEVDAYLTVAAAHRGYLKRNDIAGLTVIDLHQVDLPLGGFGFPRHNSELKEAVDAALADILGSPAHRALMARYGFSDADIDHICRRAQ